MAYEVTETLPEGIERAQVKYIEERCEGNCWEFVSYGHTRTTTDGIDEVRVYMYIWSDAISERHPFFVDSGFCVAKFYSDTADSLYDDDYGEDETCASFDIFRDELPAAVAERAAERVTDYDYLAAKEYLDTIGLAIDDIVNKRVREACRDALASYEQKNQEKE